MASRPPLVNRAPPPFQEQRGERRTDRGKADPEFTTEAERGRKAELKTSTTKRRQPSALGGDVATRSKVPADQA